MSSPARLHSRACAAVTAASCFAHLWLAVGNHHAAWLNALMVAMVAVCLPCAVHIWRHSRVAALQRVMASAVTMTAVHAFVLLAAGRSTHSHGAPAAGGLAESAGALAESAGGTGESDAVVLLLVIALEMTTAFLAATLVARLRTRGQRERTLPALRHEARTGT
ncbi:hypothetical protein [Arthrobacter sp. ISL-28]|uniref:hypothetical protein n=1 Tax=Arthrobacter sp. ISL-28 TaxID=2819108 RepID=UPI001BEAC93A|nr:hypothetical protein [Arthrobacter sp. ISL-28]MBT2521072.1 hypothetical protein [Arthrobacter sp. ISL-28]